MVAGQGEVFCMLSINQTGVTHELDSLCNHKMLMKTVTSEKFMDNRAFEHLTTEDDGIKITLEFPCSPQDDSAISEVKNILAGILNEYLENES